MFVGGEGHGLISPCSLLFSLTHGGIRRQMQSRLCMICYAQMRIIVCLLMEGALLTLKKIYAMHVIKLGFAPKTYPPWQYKYCK